jgi:catechol 2,3-dioxygenase-like lactoylglutathione lyase family enzyme
MRRFNFWPVGMPALLAMAGALPPAAASTLNPFALRPHHITASVANLDRAVAWYQQMLGFAVRERGSHGPVRFVELAIPGFGIALIQDPSTPVNPNPKVRTSPYWVHMVFSAPDPNAVFQVLKSKGAELSTRDDAANGAVHGFTVKDSEGNEIEIVGEALP